MMRPKKACASAIIVITLMSALALAWFSSPITTAQEPPPAAIVGTTTITPTFTATATTTSTSTPTLYYNYMPIIVDGADPEVSAHILSSNWINISGPGWNLVLQVVGEVINNSPRSIKNIHIQGTSSDGSMASAYTDMDSIGPGMKSPFLISFEIGNPGLIWCDGDYWHDLRVENCEVASWGPYELQITSQSAYYTSDGSIYNIEGTVRNQTGEKRTTIKAFVTLYNSASEAIGRGWTYAQPTDLEPGQNATFDVTIDNWRDCPGGNHDIASYQLKVVDD